ncbi:aldose 1-epimerase [Nocardia sp. alder85J]|uniref:aldose epimerase family protein n=1 Tax=Nocardia sp. alder85J TaxID=2862949 RepID=UPI001CD73765|nr:aldose 1-epimerase [Nocardia sp. alder85J]MCX4097095.1 aldose 1-epimerase [Nocardia sp. alder85J]
MSDRDVRLTAGAARLTVDPATGRITQFGLGAAELLHIGPRFGSFPMAPWCGRMRDGVLHWADTEYRLPRTAAPHAIHGTVRDKPWQVLRHSDTEAVLAQDLTDPWPFPGRVTQSITLSPDQAEFTMTVEAFADPFPAQVGWHPWFERRLTATGPGVEVDFAPAWQEQRGADHLPDGNRITPLPGPWDDCFGMPGGVHVTLTWPGAVELVVGSPLEWVVVYDQPADTVCVEPQSGPPNGLNTAPHEVRPDSPLVGRMTWRWRTLG